jgi:hypothetical protein
MLMSKRCYERRYLLAQSILSDGHIEMSIHQPGRSMHTPGRTPCTIDENDSQHAKHFEPRISTLQGMTIDLSDDCENAEESIRINCEFDSNEIDENCWHHEKQDEFNISTLCGISIDLSDDCENADDSIRVNCEFDSNEIDESDLQNEKQDEPRIETLAGIITCESVTKLRINVA